MCCTFQSTCSVLVYLVVGGRLDVPLLSPVLSAVTPTQERIRFLPQALLRPLQD